MLDPGKETLTPFIINILYIFMKIFIVLLQVYLPVKKTLSYLPAGHTAGKSVISITVQHLFLIIPQCNWFISLRSMHTVSIMICKINYIICRFCQFLYFFWCIFKRKSCPFDSNLSIKPRVLFMKCTICMISQPVVHNLSTPGHIFIWYLFTFFKCHKIFFHCIKETINTYILQTLYKLFMYEDRYSSK